MTLSHRTECFTDSVIRRMTRISMQYDAVNLSQGFPDFDPPQAIMDRLAEVAHQGPHQYAITWGAQNFREALARKQSRFMGRPIDPNKEIVATCGSTEAMMCAMLTVTNPGTLSKEDCRNIFLRFYRVDAARSGGGYGLGLPIAKGIVQDHGGKIWAESRDGTVTFSVQLPFRK